METTAYRLKKIMRDRNLRQIDILNMSQPFQKKYDIFMNKTNLSQYVNGKSNPDQHKVFLLGKTLDVSEAWLLGYDVPMEPRQTTKSVNTHMFKLYTKLDQPRKKEVDNFIQLKYDEQQKDLKKKKD